MSMRVAKIAVFLLMTALIAGSALAQSEVIARAYRTVNVRSGPGTQYAIIGQLTSGNEVQITGRSDEDSNWLRISFEGREGWVAYFTVAVIGATDMLQVVIPLDEQTVPTSVPRTPTAVQALTDVYVTAYRTVNVRSGPGTQFSGIGSLEAGSTADVTGRTNDDVWLRINFAGQGGWVAFFVVSLAGSLDEVEIVEDAGEENGTQTADVTTRYNVNLHEEPALDSSVIEIVPFDTTLEAQARSNAAASWLQVTFNQQVGWLLRALVNASGELNRLPIRQH